MNMFNAKGQVNAANFQELLQNLIKYASFMQDNEPSNLSLSSSMSDDKKDELVARAIMTQDGKMSLAQAMANPIRKNLDYHGIFRRALVVDELAPGALATYERDIDVSAMIVSSNGSGSESRVFGDRITVPEFELFANPTVRIAEVKRRRFNIIERAVQKARQEIMAQEDAAGFSAFDAASSVENTLQDVTDTGMVKRDLVEIKIQIDRWDLVTSKFFMNINEFSDILKWGAGGGQGSTGGDFDPVQLREVMQTGLYGSIFGADIMVSKIVPAGTIFGCADPEFVGVMPVRQGIEVMPSDEPKQLKLGWVVSEIIGLAICNPRGVAAGKKSVTIGA